MSEEEKAHTKTAPEFAVKNVDFGFVKTCDELNLCCSFDLAL